MAVLFRRKSSGVSTTIGRSVAVVASADLRSAIPVNGSEIVIPRSAGVVMAKDAMIN